MDVVIAIVCIIGFFVFVEYGKNKKGKLGPIGKILGKQLFK